MMTSTVQTAYEALGGEAGVRALVKNFYALMDDLPETFALRMMHPERLSGSETSLFEFLSGWFGGPDLYVAKKGHPRLRMRHENFRVSPAMRDQWLLCMTQALDAQVADTDLRSRLIEKFSQMASHLLNSPDAAAGTVSATPQHGDNISLNLSKPRTIMKTAHDLVTAAKARVQEVAIAEAEQAIREADVLLDVREADEYAAGHLPGAIHASRGLLEFKLSSSPELNSRDLRIVLYCKTSGRAALAACALHDMGYLQVKSISGGFDAWLTAGKPIVKPSLPAFE